MIVLALVLVPIAVGLALPAIPRSAERAAKTIGMLAAAATVVLAVAARGDEWTLHWLARPFDAALHFGLTPISFWIALLAGVCTFSAVAGTSGVRARDLIALLLLSEGTMLALFAARDLLLFALCWDLMLIPVFLILVRWGEHPAVAWRYFLYNFAGGVVLLLAAVAFGLAAGTTDVIGVPGVHLAGTWVPWIMAGFAAGFLVKTPVWPFHTWMPPTYTSLPPPAAALISGVQSKAGPYGFIAVGLALMPQQMQADARLLIVLGLIGLLYGAFAALVQADVKRIVAYSSLSHLGLMLVAICSFDPLALDGVLVYIVAHGLFSAALFLALGFIEEREETRVLARLGGLDRHDPRLAGAFHIAALAALGLPGLAGFAGELIMLIGVYRAGLILPAILALVAIVTASAYMLRLYQDAMQGPLRPELPVRRDMTWSEGIALAPLLVALIVLGIYPTAILRVDMMPYVPAVQMQVQR